MYLEKKKSRNKINKQTKNPTIMELWKLVEMKLLAPNVNITKRIINIEISKYLNVKNVINLFNWYNFINTKLLN